MPIKILAIDDEKLMTDVIYNFLTEFDDYCVTCCNDIKSAYHLVTNVTPDLILLDLNVPNREDGLKFARTIKQSSKYSHIPLIFVTSHNEASDIEGCFYSGAIDYLSKPFTQQSLLNKVKTHSNIGKANNLINNWLEAYHVQ